MDWDFIVRTIYLVVGICAALSLGWVVWNSRLLYYRLWCWFNYKRKIFRRKRADR